MCVGGGEGGMVCLDPAYKLLIMLIISCMYMINVCLFYIQRWGMLVLLNI